MTAHPKYQVLNTGRAKSLNTQGEEETEYRLSQMQFLKKISFILQWQNIDQLLPFLREDKKLFLSLQSLCVSSDKLS